MEIDSSTLIFYRISTFTNTLVPYFDSGLQAGFPSPAQDYTELKIDLNEELIRNPDATFFVRIKGKSMVDAGLNDGDVLIIDRSLEPANGKIAVCFLDGGFTVKRLKVEKEVCWLLPENPDYKPIKVTPENDFVIWGIVTYVIKAT